MSSALVTGCAGFIGSFLTEELLSRDYYVWGADNLFRGRTDNMEPYINNRRFKFERIDLARKTIPSSLLKDVETVFHYAAINGTRYFYESPEKVFMDNIKATSNVLNAMERTSTVERIIFASSSEVYGDALYCPTDEEHPILIRDVKNPRNSYALSKVFSEFYVKTLCESRSIRYIILRIFNTYGERMDTSAYAQVIPEFIRKLTEPIFQVIGDGQQTRCFCHISDHVAFALKAAEKASNEILNVGNDEEVKIADLARLMHRIANKSFKPVYLPPREGDIRRRVPDISKIRRLTEYSPKVSLEEGVKRCIRWYFDKWHLRSIDRHTSLPPTWRNGHHLSPRLSRRNPLQHDQVVCRKRKTKSPINQ